MNLSGNLLFYDAILKYLLAEITGLLWNAAGKISWGFALLLLCAAIGCQRMPVSQLKTDKAEATPVLSPPIAPAQTAVAIDVSKLAYKSPAEFEQIFGKAVEVKAVKGDARQMPGEYRLYQTPNHPQGLSVHFYNGQALIFNLVLGEAQKSPGEALLKYFAIDVGKAAPVEKTQFLEKWRGKFNGVNFVTVYAMKERVEREDYKLLHAEVAK